MCVCCCSRLLIGTEPRYYYVLNIIPGAHCCYHFVLFFVFLVQKFYKTLHRQIHFHFETKPLRRFPAANTCLGKFLHLLAKSGHNPEGSSRGPQRRSLISVSHCYRKTVLISQALEACLGCIQLMKWVKGAFLGGDLTLSPPLQPLTVIPDPSRDPQDR